MLQQFQHGSTIYNYMKRRDITVNHFLHSDKPSSNIIKHLPTICFLLLSSLLTARKVGFATLFVRIKSETKMDDKFDTSFSGQLVLWYRLYQGFNVRQSKRYIWRKSNVPLTRVQVPFHGTFNTPLRNVKGVLYLVKILDDHMRYERYGTMIGMPQINLTLFQPSLPQNRDLFPYFLYFTRKGKIFVKMEKH